MGVHLRAGHVVRTVDITGRQTLHLALLLMLPGLMPRVLRGTLD